MRPLSCPQPWRWRALAPPPRKRSRPGAQGIVAQDFVSRAASGGLFELRSGELALQRSRDDRIRSFGGTMIRDHRANNGDLVAMATNQGLLIPDELAEPDAGMMQAIDSA